MVHDKNKPKLVLLHFADSNQSRQQELTELKTKLREKVLKYNDSEEEKIDADLACNLSQDYILPWQRHGEGMYDNLETVFQAI